MNDQLCDQRGHLSNRITRLRSFRPSVRRVHWLTVGLHSNAKAQPYTDCSNILADTM
jgi:hypothetical protein